MKRALLISTLCIGAACVALPAHAAYQARVLVAAGPLFNASPVVSGEGTTVSIRRDVAPTDMTAHLVAPGGVAVARGATERIYVADVATLREIDATTGAIRNVLPLMDAEFYPTTVGIMKAEAEPVVVAASWISGRVRVINTVDGSVIRDEADLAQPYDVVALADGTLVVAEAGKGRVLALMPDGARNILADGFQQPMGLVLAGDDTLYVTDRAAGTLTALNLKTQSRIIAADDLEAPEGVARLPDGTLAVVETRSRTLRSITPGQKAAKPVYLATNLALGNQAATAFSPKLGQPADARLFNGLAVGTDGTIYLPSDMQTVLYALKPGGGPSSFMDMIRGLTSKVFR